MAETAINESNINDYVDDYRNLEVSYDTLHFLDACDVENSTNDHEFIIIPYDSLLTKYKTDLDELIITKTLTTEEQNRYFYNPWILSYDLYGTTEFWYLLLEVNSMYSINEFNQEKIKIYNGSLLTFVERILSIEEDFITENNASIEAVISGTNNNYTESTEKLDNDADYIDVI